jgi:uncharacterized protein (DUF3084 family)
MSEITKKEIDALDEWLQKAKDEYTRAEALLSSIKEQEQKERQNIIDLGINPDKAEEEIDALKGKVKDLYAQAIASKNEAQKILDEARG